MLACVFFLGNTAQGNYRKNENGCIDGSDLPLQVYFFRSAGERFGAFGSGMVGGGKVVKVKRREVSGGLQ